MRKGNPAYVTSYPQPGCAPRLICLGDLDIKPPSPPTGLAISGCRQKAYSAGPPVISRTMPISTRVFRALLTVAAPDSPLGCLRSGSLLTGSARGFEPCSASRLTCVGLEPPASRFAVCRSRPRQRPALSPRSHCRGFESRPFQCQKAPLAGPFGIGAADGTRTHDTWNHNPVL